MSRSRETLCCLSPVAAAVALALASSPSFAQTTPAAKSDEELAEVVVTARFHEENLQTTPLAISAFSEEELAARSITNVSDLGGTVPNAFVRQSVSNYGPTETIGMRGLIQGDYAYAFEPAVGIYIDDIYHGTLTGSTMDLLDLERVEVLRGPQGTLFGINTMGGAVRLISKKPSADEGSSLDLTYGSRDRIDAKGVADFAVIPDKVFARVSGIARRQDGYGQRLDFTCEMYRRGTPELAGVGDGKGAGGVAVTPGSAADISFPQTLNQRNGCELGSLGGSESIGTRAQLRFLTTDKLEINLSGDYSTEIADPPVEAQLVARNDTGYAATVLNRYGLNITTLEKSMVSPDPYTNFATFGNVVDGTAYDPNVHLHSWGMSATADYDTPWPKTHLKLISGYRKYDTTWINDSDLTPFELLQTPSLQQHHQFQAEAQFTGLSFADKLDWTLGAFYYDSWSRSYYLANFVTFNLKFTADDLYTTKNTSLFAHATYKLTDRLSLSGGLRYSDENKTNWFRHYGPGQYVGAAPLGFGSNHVSYKVGLDFQATDALFLYTSVSDGFTSAGVTPRIFTPEQLQPLDGEQVTNYELGAKLEMFDHKVRINSAVFYMDYSKRLQQVTARECAIGSNGVSPGQPVFGLGATDPCPAGTPSGDLPLSAGTARNGTSWFYYMQAPGNIQGFETEISLFPVRDFMVNVAAGYNEFKGDQKTRTAINYRDPSAVLQPKWNISAGTQYALALGDGARLTPRVDYSFQSYRTNGTISLPQRDPDDRNGGYGLVNARVTFDPPEGHWQAAFAVLNVFDKFYWQQIGTATTRAGVPSTGRVGTPGRPREWSFTISKKFN
ncbi:MAG: TonB-dependent receptor [Pseudomonadota bacterium]